MGRVFLKPLKAPKTHTHTQKGDMIEKEGSFLSPKKCIFIFVFTSYVSFRTEQQKKNKTTADFKAAWSGKKLSVVVVFVSLFWGLKKLEA